MNPFDYVNAINKGKDIMSDTDNDELAEKGYNAFLTNKQFSYLNKELTLLMLEVNLLVQDQKQLKLKLNGIELVQQ